MRTLTAYATAGVISGVGVAAGLLLAAAAVTDFVTVISRREWR